MREGMNELLHDLFCLNILIEVQKDVKKYESNEYLGTFIWNVGSIILFEFTKEFFSEGKHDNKWVYKEGVNEEIVNVLKNNRNLIKKHSYYKKFRNNFHSMGISTDVPMIDIVISYIPKKEIIGFNFNNFDLQEDREETQLHMDAIKSLANILAGIFIQYLESGEILDENDLNNNIFTSYYREKIRDNFQETVKYLDNIEFKRISYSARKLFNIAKSHKEIRHEDISFTLRRLEELKQLDYIRNSVSKSLTTSIRKENFKINWRMFFLKQNAIVIDSIINQDFKKTKTVYIKNIKMKCIVGIESDFFGLNRRLKNNIHYAHIDNFTETELDLIEKNQKKFKNNFYNAIEPEINFKPNLFYKVATRYGMLVNQKK